MDAVQRLRLAEINLAALEFAADTVERALEILRADQGFEPDSSRASTCAPVRASACARDDHPSDDKKIRKDDPRDWLDTTVYQIDDHPEAERIEQAIAAMRPELDARDRAAVWRDFARLNDRKRVSLGLEPKKWHIKLLRGFAKTWRDLLGNFQKGLRAAYAERKEAEKREAQRLAAERKAEVAREARVKAEQKKPTAATSAQPTSWSEISAYDQESLRRVKDDGFFSGSRDRLLKTISREEYDARCAVVRERIPSFPQRWYDERIVIAEARRR